MSATMDNNNTDTNNNNNNNGGNIEREVPEGLTTLLCNGINQQFLLKPSYVQS